MFDMCIISPAFTNFERFGMEVNWRTQRQALRMGTVPKQANVVFSQESSLFRRSNSVQSKGFFVSADNKVCRERAEKYRLGMQEASNGVDILGAAFNALVVISNGAQRIVYAPGAGGYKLASSVLDNKGTLVVNSHRNPEYCGLYLWTLDGSWQARLNHKIAEAYFALFQQAGTSDMLRRARNLKTHLFGLGVFLAKTSRSHLCAK